MFFQNAGWKSKIFNVNSAFMKSYLLVLVALAINAKMADSNVLYTECDLTKL